MARFTDDQLKQLSIDPREPAAWTRCPFCGADIVLGVHKDTRNYLLWHEGHQDPTDPTRTHYTTACERFEAALRDPAPIQRLYDAGARFQRVVS